MSRPGPEHRRTPRLQPFVVPCTVLSEARKLRGFLTDLSHRGARISCEAGVPEDGSEVVIEVRFSRRAKMARLPGRVRWSRPSEAATASFGVLFESPSAEARALLESVVEEFRRRAELIS